MRVFICIAIPLIAISAAYLFFPNVFHESRVSGSDTGSSLLFIEGTFVRVGIAETDGERAKGLSGRSKLDPHEGMLFVFERDGMYGFWMKDMFFPIDILWLSSDKKVVHIEKGVLPESYPRSFGPSVLARYVLELPAGFTEAYNVRVGSLAEW